MSDTNKCRGDDLAFADDPTTQYTAGLTKREWFAGMALCGIQAEGGGSISGDVNAAVKLADALIEALNNE